MYSAKINQCLILCRLAFMWAIFYKHPKIRKFATNILLFLYITVFLFFATPSQAAGIPVFDGANLTQGTISAFEAVTARLKQMEQYATQLQQYMTQLQQYEDQVRNTVAPAMYMWSEVQSYMSKIMALQNKMEALMDEGANGGIQEYLKTFGDPDYYGNTEYFKTQGARTEKFIERERQGMELQRAALKNVLDNQKASRDQLRSEAGELQRLQSGATSAVGRMQAVQYGNQFASHMNNQLLQMRAALQTQQELMATEMSLQRDRDARDKATTKLYHAPTKLNKNF